MLSAADDREGGRGVRIWHADDLRAPDEAFGAEHRPGFIRRHPKALRTKGRHQLFQFEPGRLYRVRFVKEERKSSLYVDGRLVLSGETRPTVSGDLAGRIQFLSYTSGEIDDLTVSGVLDPDWLRGRK